MCSSDLIPKQGRTHYWESVARGLRNAVDYTSRIFQGAGNVIGSMRPGAQIFRNDYGPRNTTIYNSSNGIGY